MRSLKTIKHQYTYRYNNINYTRKTFISDCIYCRFIFQYLYSAYMNNACKSPLRELMSPITTSCSSARALMDCVCLSITRYVIACHTAWQVAAAEWRSSLIYTLWWQVLLYGGTCHRVGSIGKRIKLVSCW